MYYQKTARFEIPKAQIESIALAYEEAASKAFDKLLAKSTKEHEYKLKVMEQVHAEVHPESGSYEGNFTDEIGDVIQPTWDQVNKVIAKDMVTFIEGLKLKPKAKWLLPMLDTYIKDNMKLYSVAGSVNPATGKAYIDGTKTAQIFSEASRFNAGVLILYTCAGRSAFLSSQTAADHRNYSTMVPLVLAVFKRYGYGSSNSVPYSAWSPEHLTGIVAPNLLTAMLAEPPEFSDDDIIKTRDYLFGSAKPVATTFSMYGKGNTPFAEVDQLVAHTILQSWACHPKHRTKYTILDVYDWDNIPKPLIDTEVMTTEEIVFGKMPKVESDTSDALPWE